MTQPNANPRYILHETPCSQRPNRSRLGARDHSALNGQPRRLAVRCTNAANRRHLPDFSAGCTMQPKLQPQSIWREIYSAVKLRLRTDFDARRLTLTGQGKGEKSEPKTTPRRRLVPLAAKYRPFLNPLFYCCKKTHSI